MQRLKCISLILFLLLNATLRAQTYQQFLAEGDSCVARYDVFHALRAYQKAERVKLTVAVKLRLADCYYQRADYNRCAKILKALPADSLTHDAYRQLFYGYYFQKDYGRCIPVGKALVARYPDDGQIVAELAAALNLCDFSPEALQYVQAYCRRDSSNILVSRQYAFAYFYQRQFREASHVYDRLLALGDTTVNTLYMAGMTYEQLGDSLTAYRCLHRAAEKNNYQTARMLYHLARVTGLLKRYDEARKLISKGIGILDADRSLETDFYVLRGKINNEDPNSDTHKQKEAEKKAIEAMTDHPLTQRILALSTKDPTNQTRWVELLRRSTGYPEITDSLYHALGFDSKLSLHDATAILDSCGWVSMSKVQDASVALWLVVLHAPADILRKELPVLAIGAATGDLGPDALAQLQDRLAVLEGRPQRFGTQYITTADGHRELAPLLDPSRVDRWRNMVGMKTLSANE